jgi:acetyltransferase
MRDAALAVYTFPEDAARALAAMVRYGRWVRRPSGVRRKFDDMDRAGIDRLVQSVRDDGRVQLTLAEAQNLFACAGIPVLPWRDASSRDDAVAAANALGYPVVAKVSSSAIVHKSEVGGVRVGLESPDEVGRAFDEIMAAARKRDARASLVIQRQAGEGTEVILGATRDAKFGPC